MNRNQVYVTVIATMECVDSLVNASSLVLEKLTPAANMNDFKVTRHRVTQWTDPVSQAMTVTDSGRFKYTINTSLTFNTDDEYAGVQQWAVAGLMQDEEHTHMIIQALDITMATYTEALKDVRADYEDTGV